jgi:ATP-dependent Clp protease ATP-binding subunit ClpA
LWVDHNQLAELPASMVHLAGGLQRLRLQGNRVQEDAVPQELRSVVYGQDPAITALASAIKLASNSGGTAS